MSLADPIGDMLTRIRNGQMRLLNNVIIPGSKFRVKILDVLKQATEGQIMVSEILVKIVAVILLISVAVVLILGIKTLFKGNEDKKYSNKLMQLRVLLQFIAIIVLVGLAYFFKN